MRKIAVFTGTRAEYGLLYWLMKEIQQDPEFELQVIASGMHLSPEFGATWKAIECDGFSVDAKVEMLLSSDTPVGVAKSIGLGTIGFADALDRLQSDCLVILGDRFEALAIAQTALVMRIPIAHIHGGEITEGAYDDAIRHAITKLSHWHFVATEEYRQRVMQLGEAPSHVFNVGALGLENIKKTKRLNLNDLSGSLGFSLKSPFFLVTYHPVTAGDEVAEVAFGELLNALDSFPNHQVLFTYPNSDNSGRALIAMIEQYIQKAPDRANGVISLGLQRYLSAAALADAVIGNSSSGIIEVPSLGVPTVNIGCRQKGRLSAKSIIHCAPQKKAIIGSIHKALDKNFTDSIDAQKNPYGEGNTSQKITQLLHEASSYGPKPFHDLPVKPEVE